MQMLNIYEFYYTFYSWNTYEIVYQLFWSSKLILIPFLFFVFEAIKSATEGGGRDVGLNKSVVSQFVILLVTFLVGAVPTVPLKVNDSLVTFLECDITVSPNEIFGNNPTNFIGNDNVKMPLVPYLMYALGSGITSSIGNNLACMQTAAISLGEVSNVPITDLSENPNLGEIVNSYKTQCESKANEFTNNLIKQFELIKVGSIYEHYVKRGWFAKTANLFNASETTFNKDSIETKYREFLTAPDKNSTYMADVVYAGNADEVIKAFNDIGRRNTAYYEDKVRQEAGMAAAYESAGMLGVYGVAIEQNASWQLNEDDEAWIKNNIPIVATLTDKEHEYLSSMGYTGANGYSIEILEGPSCNLSKAETSTSNGNDRKRCFDCSQLGKIVLDEVAFEQAKQYVKHQMSTWKSKAGYTHPVIVRPSATETYNQLIGRERLKGSAEEQRAQLQGLLNKFNAGILLDQSEVNSVIRESANGNVGPPEIVEKYAQMLLDKYPTEVGDFANKGNASISSFANGDRENFVDYGSGLAMAASIAVTKGSALATMLMKWVEIQIVKALMLQIIPMVLMLYVIFWLPFMVLGMYSPKSLLQGSAVFFAIKLIPLFTIIISSTTVELGAILDYNFADRGLINVAGGILITLLPIVILAFLASAFGSALSGSIMGAAATGSAAIAVAGGRGKGLGFLQKPKSENSNSENSNSKNPPKP